MGCAISASMGMFRSCTSCNDMCASYSNMNASSTASRAEQTVNSQLTLLKDHRILVDDRRRRSINEITARESQLNTEIQRFIADPARVSIINTYINDHPRPVSDTSTISFTSIFSEAMHAVAAMGVCDTDRTQIQSMLITYVNFQREVEHRILCEQCISIIDSQIAGLENSFFVYDVTQSSTDIPLDDFCDTQTYRTMAEPIETYISHIQPILHINTIDTSLARNILLELFTYIATRIRTPMSVNVEQSTNSIQSAALVKQAVCISSSSTPPVTSFQDKLLLLSHNMNRT